MPHGHKYCLTIVIVRESSLTCNSNYPHYHPSKCLLSIQVNQYLLFFFFSAELVKKYTISLLWYYYALPILTGMFSKPRLKQILKINNNKKGEIHCMSQKGGLFIYFLSPYKGTLHIIKNHFPEKQFMIILQAQNITLT